MTDIKNVVSTIPGTQVQTLPNLTHRIVPYPFKDPTFEEAIKSITEGHAFKNTVKNDQALEKFQDALNKLEEIVRIPVEDYKKLVRIFPPDNAKKEESQKKAKATHDAACINANRCRGWIDGLRTVPPILPNEPVVDLKDVQANILVGVLGECLNDESYNDLVEVALKELGINEGDKQSVLELAKKIISTKASLIATPDDLIFIDQHSVNKNTKYNDKTISQWVEDLTQKLQQQVVQAPVELSTPVVPTIDPSRASLEALNILKALKKEIPIPTQEPPKKPPAPPINTDNDKVQPIKKSSEEQIGQYVVKGNEVETLLKEIKSKKSDVDKTQKLPQITEAEAITEISKIVKEEDDVPKLIKALVKDQVIRTIPQAKAVALIASRQDLAEAARETEFDKFGFDTDVMTVLDPTLDGIKTTTAPFSRLRDYLNQSIGNSFDTWYQNTVAKDMKRIYAAAVTPNFADKSVDITISPSEINTVKRSILQLITLALTSNVITKSESNMLQELIFNHDEFISEYSQLLSSETSIIHHELNNILTRLHEHYVDLGTKVNTHLLQFEHPPRKPDDVPPSAGIQNLVHWLNLNNRYFQNYLDDKYPSRKPSVPTASVLLSDAKKSTAPKPLQQITIDNWQDIKSSMFSNGNPPERRFLEAYFGIVKDEKKLPTVDLLCKKLGIQKKEFDDYKKNTIDSSFHRNELSPLPVFPKDTVLLAKVYFAFKSIQKDIDGGKIDPNQYFEKLHEAYNKLYTDKVTTLLELAEAFKQDTSQLIKIDPSVHGEPWELYLKLTAEEIRDKEAVRKEAIAEAHKWIPDEESVELVRLEISSSLSSQDNSIVNLATSQDDYFMEVKQILKKSLGDDKDISDIKYTILLKAIKEKTGIDKADLKIAWMHRSLINKGEFTISKLQEMVKKELGVELNANEIKDVLKKLNAFCDEELFKTEDDKPTIVGLKVPSFFSQFREALVKKGVLAQEEELPTIKQMVEAYEILSGGDKQSLRALYSKVTTQLYDITVMYSDTRTVVLKRDQYDQFMLQSKEDKVTV